MFDEWGWHSGGNLYVGEKHENSEGSAMRGRQLGRDVLGNRTSLVEITASPW